jgi:cytochrome c oxidase assembly protein subunit 11
MAVTFFIDPMMIEDPNLAEINTITLSYMFFPAKTQTLSDARGAAAKPAVN